MSEAYDVIIIGSGIGGLVTGCMLGKAGLNLLICEKNREIGGYASSITIDKFQFDIGAQDITFLGQRGKAIIKGLGIQQDYVRIKPQSRALFPDHEFYWSKEEETKSYFIKNFPGEEKGINSLFKTMAEIYYEIDNYLLPENLSYDLNKYPFADKYKHYTAVQLLDEFLDSSKLKSLLSAFSIFYQGSDMSRISALHFAGLLMSYFKNGAFYYMGGCSAFTKKLEAIIEENGGTIKTETEVKKILFNDKNRAIGVLTSGGREFRSKYVISNADSTYTFSNLVGLEKTSPVLKSRLKKMQVALSRCEIFLGGEMDISNLPVITFYKEGYDIQDEFDMFISNRPISFRCFAPTIIDKGLAPSGKHCLSIAVVASYDLWEKYYQEGEGVYFEQKEILLSRILNLLKKAMPNFKEDKISVKKVITPIDLKQLTFNNKGALYGWELIPSQSGIRRLSFLAPLAGLYLTGQWTIPGGSACLIFRNADLVSSAIINDMKKSH